VNPDRYFDITLSYNQKYPANNIQLKLNVNPMNGKIFRERNKPLTVVKNLSDLEEISYI